MKKILLILIGVGICMSAVSAIAQNKVVVIPLNSNKAAGTNGQLQYNDGGKNAGAEVYFDKPTGNLYMEAEFRATDPSGNNRLWGKGRPGIGLITHTDSNGYCTTDTGIMYALSNIMVSWASAANACPQGTWVCIQNELPATGACHIVAFGTISYYACDGTEVGVGPSITTLKGWISDSYNNEGTLIPSDDFSASLQQPTCENYRVWCCRE